MIKGLDRNQKPALLISECQMGFVGGAEPLDQGLVDQAVGRGIVDNIAVLAEAFRAAELPIVHSLFGPREDYVGTGANCLLLVHIRKQGIIREGRPSVNIHPKLAPAPGELVTRRVHAVSSFHGTELESVLRNHAVQTVVLVGVSTNLAVSGSAIEAVNRGFQVVIPEDCIAGASAETHTFLVRHTLPLLAAMTIASEVVEVVKTFSAAGSRPEATATRATRPRARAGRAAPLVPMDEAAGPNPASVSGSAQCG